MIITISRTTKIIQVVPTIRIIMLVRIAITLRFIKIIVTSRIRLMKTIRTTPIIWITMTTRLI